MPRSQKAELGSQARAMYGRGGTMTEIAEALGVSEATLYRWKKSDGARGIDWDAEREEAERLDPRGLLALLKRLRAKIATDASLEAGAKSDALYKLQRTIKSIADEVGDPAVQLAVLEGFAEFCVTELREDEMPTLRRAVERYMIHLKRKASK